MNVGSMIISTLVSDLSCEHVDKFVFVDEHDRCETLTQEQEAQVSKLQYHCLKKLWFRAKRRLTFASRVRGLKQVRFLGLEGSLSFVVA